MIKNLLKWRLFKGIAIAVIIAFLSGIPAQSGYAQTLPAPGQMVHQSAHFMPPLMAGLRVDLKDPFRLYFVMSDGDKALAQDKRQPEYQKLIKYFMASLSLPNRDMWVNLSPKEADRIIPDNFSMTEMGRDLLAQDYLLKQFTASLMDPQGQLGKDFWEQIYKTAYQKYGTTDIPVDTFNKVWITADKANIFQKDDTAFLVDSHLKVMLEQDFVSEAGNKEMVQGIFSDADALSSASRQFVTDIVRNVIVPVIEKEVNEGANFAPVRQAYQSMILATWFKKALKDSLLGQIYADQSKVQGITINDPQMKERIYQQYLEAYKVGVFNYIKEEMDPATQELLPRKYFSGGIVAVDSAVIRTDIPLASAEAGINNYPRLSVLPVDLLTTNGEKVLPAPVQQAPVVKDQKKDENQAQLTDIEKQLQVALDKNGEAQQAVEVAQAKVVVAQAKVADLKEAAQKSTVRAVMDRVWRSVRRQTWVLGFLLVTVMVFPLAGCMQMGQKNVSQSAPVAVMAAVGANQTALKSPEILGAKEKIAAPVAEPSAPASVQQLDLSRQAEINANKAAIKELQEEKAKLQAEEAEATASVKQADQLRQEEIKANISALEQLQQKRANLSDARRELAANIEALSVLNESGVQDPELYRKRVEEIRANAIKARADLQALSETVNRALQNPEIKQNREFLTLYLKLETSALASLSGLVNIGGVNVGLGVGGEIQPYFRAGEVGYGLATKAVTGAGGYAIAGLVLLDAAVDIIQQPNFRLLSDVGGVLRPDSRAKFLGLNLIFFRVGFQDGHAVLRGMDHMVKVGVDLGDVVDLSVGLNKRGPLVDIRAAGFKLLTTEYGDLLFNPRIDDRQGTITPLNAKQYVDLTIPGEDLGNYIKRLTQRSGKALPREAAIVIYGLHQRAAWLEALANSDPRVKYFVERKGAEQNIYRSDSVGGQKVLLSTAKMYYPKADFKANGFETESFLRLTGNWMEQDGLMPASGMADLIKLAPQALQMTAAFGGETDFETNLQTVYSGYEDIPTAVGKNSPKFDQSKNVFIYENGQLKMNGAGVASGVNVNPWTGNMMQSGYRTALLEYFFHNVGAGDHLVQRSDAGPNDMIHVPQVIIRTFRDQSPRTIMVDGPEMALMTGLPIKILGKGEEIRIKMGGSLNDIVIGEGASVTYAEPLAVRMGDVVIPAIIEYAKVKDLKAGKAGSYGMTLDPRTGEVKPVDVQPAGTLAVQPFDQAGWERLIESKVKPPTVADVMKTMGIDVSKKGLAAAREELKQLSVARGITLKQRQAIEKFDDFLSVYSGIGPQSTEQSAYVGIHIPPALVNDMRIAGFWNPHLYSGNPVHNFGVEIGSVRIIGKSVTPDFYNTDGSRKGYMIGIPLKDNNSVSSLMGALAGKADPGRITVTGNEAFKAAEVKRNASGAGAVLVTTDGQIFIPGAAAKENMRKILTDPQYAGIVYLNNGTDNPVGLPVVERGKIVVNEKGEMSLTPDDGGNVVIGGKSYKVNGPVIVNLTVQGLDEAGKDQDAYAVVYGQGEEPVRLTKTEVSSLLKGEKDSTILPAQYAKAANVSKGQGGDFVVDLGNGDVRVVTAKTMLRIEDNKAVGIVDSGVEMIQDDRPGAVVEENTRAIFNDPQYAATVYLNNGTDNPVGLPVAERGRIEINEKGEMFLTPDGGGNVVVGGKSYKVNGPVIVNLTAQGFEEAEKDQDSYAGVYVQGQEPVRLTKAVVASLLKGGKNNTIVPAQYAKAANVSKGKGGDFVVDFGKGNVRTVTAQTMLRIKDSRAVGIVVVGVEMLKDRNTQLATEAKVLRNGGLSVYSESAERDIVFAKGNDLTPEQVAAGIEPAKKLVAQVASNKTRSILVVPESAHAREFKVGSLDVPQLRKALRINNGQNAFILNELGVSVDDLDTVREADFLKVFNHLLLTTDLHVRLKALANYNWVLPDDLRKVLQKAQKPGVVLSEAENLRLNHALLQAAFEKGTKSVKRMVILKNALSMLPGFHAHLDDTMDGFLSKNRLVIFPGANGKKVTQWVSVASIKAGQTELPGVKLPTVLGADKAPLQGLTIDPQTFSSSDIEGLRHLGVKAVRMYYPPSVNLLLKLTKAGVTTISIDIPLNRAAYGANNMTSYYGGAVPAFRDRITLDNNNYLEYFRTLKEKLPKGVKILAEVGNEWNLVYPGWFNKPVNDATFKEMFDLIGHHAALIKGEFGDGITVTTVMGDRGGHLSDDLARALALDGIDTVGVNYYRHNISLSGDVQKAHKIAGNNKPVFIAEGGSNLSDGEERQASTIQGDITKFKGMGLSYFLMNNNGNSNREGDEALWQLGKKATAVFQAELDKQPAAPISVPRADVISQHNLALLAHAEIQRIGGPLGEKIGTMVPSFGGGYADVLDVAMPDFLKTHWLLVSKDKDARAEFFAADLLDDARTREAIRKSAFEIKRIDTNKNTTAFVYLSQQPLASRYEVVNLKDGSTTIYPLFYLSWGNIGMYPLDRPQEAIGGTMKIAEDRVIGLDGDHVKGEKAILKLDYQGRIAAVEIFAADQPDGKQELKAKTPLRVIDLLSQSITYNDENGRTLYRVRIAPAQWDSVRSYVQGVTQGKAYDRVYSSSIDSNHHGLDMVLNGHLVKGVLSVTSVKNVNGQVLVDYVDVTDSHPGQYTLIGRMIFDQDGNKLDQYTGRALLPGEVKDGRALVPGLIKDIGSFNKWDHYTYTGDLEKVFNNREIFERRDNGWVSTRTIEGLKEAEAGRNGIDFERFMAVDEVKAAMAALGVDAKTVLQFTPVVTAEGLKVIDYRKQFDPLEKKVMTVYEDKSGEIIKIVVATAFDELTGEVTQSFALNYNYELNEKFGYQNAEALRQVGRSNVAGNIFTAEVAKKYAEVTGENLWDGLHREGIVASSELIIVRANERLTNPDGSYSDQWSPDDYKVLRFNDNTGRALAVIRGNGNITINPWWNHSRLAELKAHQPVADSEIPSPNILPRSVLLHHNGLENEVTVFDRFTTDAKGNTGMRYEAVKAEFLKSVTFELSTGRKMREEFRRDLSLIARGVNRVSGSTYFSPGMILTYDPRSNVNYPVNAVDTNGKEILRWTGTTYDAKGNQVQTVQERHPVFKYWQGTQRYYDSFGEERQPEVGEIQKTPLLVALGAILLFPLTVILRAFQSSKKRNKTAATVRDMPVGRLYDEDIALAAQQRFASKVLQSLRADPNVRRLQINGDSESLFLFNLNAIYVLGVSRYIKANGVQPDQYQGMVETDKLAAWDEYAKNVGKYLAEELSRSASEVEWNKVITDEVGLIAKIAEGSANAADEVDLLDKAIKEITDPVAREKAEKEKKKKEEEIVDNLNKLDAKLRPFKFVGGGLDAQKLIGSIQANKSSDVVLIQLLNKPADQLDQTKAEDFAKAFNAVLKIRDFHTRVDVDSYVSLLSVKAKELLKRAQGVGEPLNEAEYSRLNRALLRAIYPAETKGSEKLIISNETLEDIADILVNDQMLAKVKEMTKVIRDYKAQTKDVIHKFQIPVVNRGGDLGKMEFSEHFALKLVQLSQLKHMARLKKALTGNIEEFVRSNNWTDAKLVGVVKKGNATYAQVGKADQQIWDKLEVYLATQRDRLAGALEADLVAGRVETDGEFEKVSESIGIVPGKGIADFYTSFQQFLKDNKYDQAPNRILKDSKGKEIYIENAEKLIEMVQNEELSRKDVDQYIKSLDRLTLRTFVGWGIKAIHPLLLDGTVMPRFVLAGVGLGVLTLGAVSLTGWLATPILGISAGVILAGVGAVLGIGAVIDYFKISRTQQMPLAARIGLAGVALAGAAALVAMPTLSVGILFLKVSLGVPLVVEALALTAWHRSSLGLNLYYHFRPSINPGRLRANILVWAQYFSFIGLSLVFGWVTYGWFATQLALGHGVVLALGLFMFTSTAYMTNFGLWMMGAFVASRVKPSEGAPPPSTLAKEWAGLKKDDLFLIDYVGPVLASVAVQKEQISGTSDFVPDDLLDDKGLLNSLKGNNIADQIIRGELGLDVGDLDNGTPQGLVKALNTVLRMQDFHRRIGGDAYLDLLDKNIQEILVRAQNNDPSLKENHYMKLNRALLEVMYPQKFSNEIIRAVGYFIKELLWLVNDGSPAALWSLEGIRKKAGIASTKTMQEFVEQDVREWMTVLYAKESAARISLMTDDQLMESGTQRGEGDIPADLSIVYNTPEERQQLIFAKEMNQLMSLFNPYKGGLNPYDGAVSLIGLAYMLRDTADPDGIALGKKTMFMFTSNNAGEKNEDAIQKFLRLFSHISGAEVDLTFTKTVIAMKSGAMNGMFALPNEHEASLERAKKLSKVRRMLILDRNANALDLRRHMNDLVGSLNNPELVIMDAHRNTTNTRRYLGVQNYLVETGQGNTLLGLNEKIGTGWESNMGIYSWDSLMKLSNPGFPRKSFTPEMLRANAARSQASGVDPQYTQEFGMIGFRPNAVGISEDYWAVIEQAHMLIALGYDPKYALSTAIHHKRRETFSNFELSSAVPRWAGGRNQTISSFMNQTINDIGPESFVEREAVRNTGRHYVGMPLALATLVMLPLSVLFGFNPFMGLWLGLASVGIVFNQVLRLHGWGSMMDDSGILFGTARFLFYQCRDMSIFAVRVMMETLAMINSYGGLTFVFNMSGGGGSGHDTNAWEQFKANPWTFVSFKNIVFIGGAIAALMIFATISGLTIAHVTMMFLTMFWGMNLVIGLFVSESKPGVPVWDGKGDNIAAWTGGLSAVGYAAWVYFQKSAILGLGVYGIAMYVLYKLVAAHPKGKRLVSEFNRYFVRTAAGALLFALVPASTFVKFSWWPNVTWVLTMKQFALGLAGLAGLFFGVIGIGYGKGSLDKRSVKKLYDQTVAKFWAARESLDNTRRTIISQRFHQVNIFVDQLAYKRARQALIEIQDELAGKVSVKRLELGEADSVQDVVASADDSPDSGLSLRATALAVAMTGGLLAGSTEGQQDLAIPPRKDGEVSNAVPDAQIAAEQERILAEKAAADQVISEARQQAEQEVLAARQQAEQAALELAAQEQARRDLEAQQEQLKSAIASASEPVAETPSLVIDEEVGSTEPESVITQPVSTAVVDDNIRAEEQRIHDLIQKQKDRVAQLTTYKQQLEQSRSTIAGASEAVKKEWRNAYRKVSTQIGIIEKKTLPRLQAILGNDPIQGKKDLEASIVELKKPIKALQGEAKEAAKQALAQKRKELSFVMRQAKAATLKELGSVIEAAVAIPLDQVSKLNDPEVVDTLARSNEGAGESIRFFAGLTRAQKIAALKAAIAQLKVEKAIVVAQSVVVEQGQASVVEKLAATLEEVKKIPVGGIDLNSDNLAINIQVDGSGMPLPAQFQDPRMVNIQGLTPVIRSIRPVGAANVPVFFELMQKVGASF